jgi:hypothetical protein
MEGAKKLPAKNDEHTDTAAAFWQWFIENEHRFTVLGKSESEQALSFLEELIEHMVPFNPWLKALAGPYNDEKYELIITSDGDVALFSKVEELVQAAPAINNWVITAHKPALGFEEISIELYEREFSAGTTQFYPVIQENYPDEVAIVVTHVDYNEEEDDQFQAGSKIYLENGLGELNTATKIDHYETGPIPGAGTDIIPITKLAEYLNWREKEFVEKYESVNTERPEEAFYVLEAEDGDGKPVLATIDAGFKTWPLRPAFPWMVQVDILYKGDNSGLPTEKQLQELQVIEDQIISLLPDDGTLYYIGHKTYDNYRSIYFYANEYRKNAALLHRYVENSPLEYDVMFFIRKDKYWHTMEPYFNAQGEE